MKKCEISEDDVFKTLMIHPKKHFKQTILVVGELVVGCAVVGWNVVDVVGASDVLG